MVPPKKVGVRAIPTHQAVVAGATIKPIISPAPTDLVVSTHPTEKFNSIPTGQNIRTRRTLD